MEFDRSKFIQEIEKDILWDVVVIGGGASGLGTALDAASRGFKTLIVEQADFAKGTSSRSTKLVHGGVRYLAQGDIALVYEALHERGLLFKNAPHLAREQEFIIPCFGYFDVLKYSVGLKFYDLLAGRKGFKPSAFLSKKKVNQAIPELKQKGLIGGVRYSDGQFDDARLALNIAQTCAENGGTVLNYFKVTGLKKDNEKINGVDLSDVKSGKKYSVKAKVVVNATGVFVDEILKMDVPSARAIIRPSQGVHLVLDKSFLNGESALMIPETSDGRVLFGVPWHGKLLLGTTDTPLNEHSLEPVALEQEIEFILKTAKQYLAKAPEREDVLSVFAGLRPLAAPDKDTNSTKEISRSHKLIVNSSGLVTITGGKWTTYRRMAQDVVDKVIEVGKFPDVKCVTKDKHIHGYLEKLPSGNLNVYGSDADKIQELIRENSTLAEPVLKGYAVTKAEVVWIVNNEMPQKVEDVLARRLRILFLDAKAAILMAPAVARIMAEQLEHTKEWQEEQVSEFTKLANQYLLKPFYPEVKVSENVTV